MVRALRDVLRDEEACRARVAARRNSAKSRRVGASPDQHEPTPDRKPHFLAHFGSSPSMRRLASVSSIWVV